jgi:hypothetical protein
VASDADGVTLRTSTPSAASGGTPSAFVVMAGYRRAVVDLRDPLRELRLVVAGDALAPRTLLDAVAEGARAGAVV